MPTFPLPGASPQQPMFMGNNRGQLPPFGQPMMSPGLMNQQQKPMQQQQRGMPMQQNQLGMPMQQQRMPMQNPMSMMMSGMSSINSRNVPRQLSAPSVNFQNDLQSSGNSIPLTGVSGPASGPGETGQLGSTSEGSLPKFLEGVDQEIITQFKSILRMPNMTYENKIKKIESEIVPQLDEPHQKLYQQFMNESDKMEQSKRDAIHQTINGMSSEAQNEFTKVYEILNNPNIPEEERWNKITEIYNSFKPELRNEFEEKFKPLV